MSTPEEMAQTMINNLPEKTGKSLEAWLAITLESEFQKHGQLVKWLKSEHGITHGFANLIAAKTKEKREGSSGEDDLITIQYSKGKESLKPIYDKIIKTIEKFGTELEIAPKKAYVSLRRKKQFALIQPSTKTRIDIGINLKGKEPEGRLEKSGSFNAMVSHRVRIENAKDVDKEVINWLKEAYKNA